MTAVKPRIKKKKLPRLGKNFELLAKLSSAEQSTLGGKLRSHAKRARPLAPRSTCHLVLRSSQARGEMSFLHRKNEHAVWKIIKTQARRYYIRIDRYANVGNHLHLKVYIQATKEFRDFLRSITCLIARLVTGARRGKKFGPFWDALAFTRILRTYTEQIALDRYVLANRVEATEGKAARQEFLALWYGMELANAPPLLFS
jgi:hypothetical protein